MLAYAASRPVVDRVPHPNTMLLIIGAHVALIALVMSARMDLPRRTHQPPLIIDTIPLPRPPRQQRSVQHPTHEPIDEWIDHTRTAIRLPPPTNLPPTDKGPSSGSLGGSPGATIELPPPSTIHPDPTSARLLTPTALLKPPYPASKLLNEEEAVLELRLAIDASGQVTAVEPIGRADAVFLDAARKYLIAHWRYAPATEDGHAVASSTIVTLHFELNG